MLQTAAVFSDNMVLQRNKKIRIFGCADSGSRIWVTLLGRTVATICRDGKWTAYLPVFEAADGAELEVTDGRDTIRFTNVAIGEVWLAGGQSNMELELQNAAGGADILQNGAQGAGVQRVRFYYTPKVAYTGEKLCEEERKSHWELFDEKAAAKWSAVGFFFAKKLAEQLGVTVGVIGCNWGGTSASAWMSREAILEQEATKSYIEEYDNSEWIKKPLEEQIKDYEDYEKYHADWEKRSGEIYAKEPTISFDRVQEIIGPCRYPGPMNGANFTRPAGLYETMLKRVMPYTLGGFIYYQGESDDHKPASYYALFTRMIRQWREDFCDDSLPFLLVQLPMHMWMHDADHKHWCLIREAQMKAYRHVKNTGIAVIIDCGEFNEIHPKDKKPVGERLALQALFRVYGLLKAKEAFGPLYRDFLYRDGGVEVYFDYAEGGFAVKGELSGFEIAGSDEVFYPAKAVILSDSSSIFVSAEEVKEPVMVRYLWTNYGDVNLFGTNGLPVAPFRTHEFAGK